MAIAVTENNYTETVEKSTKPVLLDVWAPWCQPCKAVEPMLAELEATYGDKFTVAKLNADDAPGLTSQLGVMSLPTVRIIQGGQITFESIGVPDRTKLTAAVSAAVKVGA